MRFPSIQTNWPSTMRVQDNFTEQRMEQTWLCTVQSISIKMSEPSRWSHQNLKTAPEITQLMISEILQIRCLFQRKFYHIVFISKLHPAYLLWQLHLAASLRKVHQGTSLQLSYRSYILHLPFEVTSDSFP